MKMYRNEVARKLDSITIKYTFFPHPNAREQKNQLLAEPLCDILFNKYRGNLHGRHLYVARTSRHRSGGGGD
jgi:hypothetical protein